MNLSWHDTSQVRLWLCLTYFYMNYCPLLKFRFPDFSLSSFDILCWNFIYEFVLTSYRSNSTLVAFDLLLHELLPFAKISFSKLFFVIFRHIDLKFHIWICLDIIQIKFNFYYTPATKLGGYTGITMSVCPSVRPSVRPHLGFRRITAFPLHLSSWNFTCRLPMSQGCPL